MLADNIIYVFELYLDYSTTRFIPHRPRVPRVGSPETSPAGAEGKTETHYGVFRIAGWGRCHTRVDY